MTQSKKQLIFWFALAIFVVAVDQWTKLLANSQLQYNVPVEILPVFDLTLRYNTGAAFSFLSDAGGWQRWFFTAIAAIVSVVLAVWLYRLRDEQTLLACGVSLVLAGAVGNLWDRLQLGYVVDFISVHWQQYYFPAFNIADSAITIGAGLMILDMILNPEQKAD